MKRYTAEIATQSGETVYVLKNPRTGAYAKIWPGFGNNCFESRIPSPSGRLVDLLLAPASLEGLRKRPSGSGIPLLFPAPGRIPRGEYEFSGQRFTLTGVDASGNTLHGFVKDRAWRVEKTEADEQQAALTCSFSSKDHADIAPGYPFPFRLETTHRLDESGLTLEARVVNEGETDMPFGFGAHPYFRIPFSSGGRREKCLIAVPASRRWNLARLAELPPNAKVSRDELTESVSKGVDLRHATELGDRAFDDALTDLELSTQAWIECSVTDPAARITAVMRATGNFETVVVYTPPKRPGLCFEPWTCPPNALNLAARGVEDTGLVVLAPRKKWEATMRLFLNPA